MNLAVNIERFGTQQDVQLTVDTEDVVSSYFAESLADNGGKMKDDIPNLSAFSSISKLHASKQQTSYDQSFIKVTQPSFSLANISEDATGHADCENSNTDKSRLAKSSLIAAVKRKMMSRYDGKTSPGPTVKRKRGRPKKEQNQQMKKRGRPRKEVSRVIVQGHIPFWDSVEQPMKRKRGRPKKQKPENKSNSSEKEKSAPEIQASLEAQEESSEEKSSHSSWSSLWSDYLSGSAQSRSSNSSTVNEFHSAPVKRKRGRPKKLNKNAAKQVVDDLPVMTGKTAHSGRENREGEPGLMFKVDLNEDFHDAKLQASSPKSRRTRLPDVFASGKKDGSTFFFPLDSKNKKSAKWKSDSISNDSLPRKRGRPSKASLLARGIIGVTKVGRPKKQSTDYTPLSNKAKKVVSKLSTNAYVPRKRGRPKKNITNEERSAQLVSNTSQSETFAPITVNKADIDSTLSRVVRLCSFMHQSGWAPGATGCVALRNARKLYVAPEGVSRDEISIDDVVIKNLDGPRCVSNGHTLQSEIPSAHESRSSRTELDSKHLESVLSPLVAIENLRDAGAIFHSQAESAVLASLLFKGEEFRVTHQEMLTKLTKGSSTSSYRFDETLVVPIIENGPVENVCKNLELAMKLYPDSNAVLVRRHGAFIWGETWQMAKAQAECYHYLFSLAVRMKLIDVEPDQYPRHEYGISSV